VKTVADVRAELERKLSTHWHTWLTSSGTASGGEAARWPLTISLGRPEKEVLKATFAELNRAAIQWQDFAKHQDLQVTWTNRRISGTTLNFPTHLALSDLTQAAAVAGNGWPERLRDGDARWAVLQSQFGPSATAKELRYAATLDDVTFEMLCRAADWFRHHDAAGMTPRQVPLEGVHGKWLNRHHACLTALAGRETLGLVDRSSRILFNYLDPQHLERGGRRHDSHTIGDVSARAYAPQTVIICENKDTALLFHQVPGAVSIFGNGDAASRQLPHLPWLQDVPTILYWGDIDSDGFECLNSLRAAGIPAESILMDQDTYAAYERYGSWTDSAGKPLNGAGPKPLQHLTDGEAQLYGCLSDPTWQRVRRIEQERIPLRVGQLAASAAALRRPL
jgi:hypothetical protein